MNACEDGVSFGIGQQRQWARSEGRDVAICRQHWLLVVMLKADHRVAFAPIDAKKLTCVALLSSPACRVAVAEGRLCAFIIFLQNEVRHARYCIGPVDCGGRVRKDFYALDSGNRNDGYVDAAVESVKC